MACSLWRRRIQPSPPWCFPRLLVMTSNLVLGLSVSNCTLPWWLVLNWTTDMKRVVLPRVLLTSYLCWLCFSKWTAALPSPLYNGAFTRRFSLFSNLVPWISHVLAQALLALSVFYVIKAENTCSAQGIIQKVSWNPWNKMSRPWLFIFSFHFSRMPCPKCL